jgi:hypothetical protein
MNRDNEAFLLGLACILSGLLAIASILAFGIYMQATLGTVVAVLTAALLFVAQTVEYHRHINGASTIAALLAAPAVTGVLSIILSLFGA